LFLTTGGGGFDACGRGDGARFAGCDIVDFIVARLGEDFGAGLDVDGVDDLLDVDADDFGDEALAFPLDALFDTDDFFADVLVLPVDVFRFVLAIFSTFCFSSEIYCYKYC